MLSTVSSLPVPGDAGQAGVGCAHREPLWLRAIGANRPQEKAVAPQPRPGAGKGPPLQSSGGVMLGRTGGSVPGDNAGVGHSAPGAQQSRSTVLSAHKS